MKVLIDLNILLDVVLGREPWAFEAQRLCDRVEAGSYDAVVAASSVPNLYYIANKSLNAAAALAAVDFCVESFELVPLNEQILRRARALPAGDFEDNIQIACAEAAGADYIITRDAVDFKSSIIPPIDALEFTRRF